MRIPLQRTLLFTLLFAPSLQLAAQQSDALAMADLMALLQTETEIATQNKMNADYVPGMVTVLHGDELRAYGAATLADALNDVAGFYMTVNNTGDPVAIVRGVGASLNGNNLKILIDGVAVNRPVDASADWAFRLPMTQIERIEVIRGPGSALYGEFAFSGVINVVTRHDNSASISTGRHGLVQGDALYTHRFDTGAELSLNASAWDHGNSGELTEPDNFARRGPGGNSPGKIYDHESGKMLFLDSTHHGYRLQLKYADIERGGWYGRNGAMPYELEPRQESIVSADIEKKWYLSNDLTLNGSLGYLQTSLEEATYLPIPIGEDPPGPARLITENRFRQDANKDAARRAELNWQWSGIQRHRLLLGVSYVHSEVTSSWKTIRIDDGAPMRSPDNQALVLDGSERDLYSATLQDQWTLLDTLEITVGARYDDYDDWGHSISPRAAAVWRASDNHIVKAQYAEAFRPPTLADQNPGPNTFPGTLYSPLQEERLKSAEIAYIYNGTGYNFRSTLFNTQVKDLIEFFIQPGRPPTWRNRGDLDTRGVELEWQQRINRDWEWHANLSYVDGDDKFDADNHLFGVVEWLANIGISWRATPRAQHTLSARYVGDQEGYDPASGPAYYPDHYDGYTTIDYAVTLSSVLNLPDLSLQAGINNLTDRRYHVVSNPQMYANGLPLGERAGWLKLEYQY